MQRILTERERGILMYRTVKRLTLEETGHKFGVTRDRIRQIEGKALDRLSQDPEVRALHGLDPEDRGHVRDLTGIMRLMFALTFSLGGTR